MAVWRSGASGARTLGITARCSLIDSISISAKSSSSAMPVVVLVTSASSGSCYEFFTSLTTSAGMAYD